MVTTLDMDTGYPAAWATTLNAYVAGDISGQIALTRMLLSGDPPTPERLMQLAPLTMSDQSSLPLAALAALAHRHRDQLAALAQLAATGIAPQGADLVASTREIFDRMALAAPEAAVAFYSLGDPALLDQATAELLATIRSWVPIERRAVLDFGCGIGRVTIALAPEVASVVGLDLSSEMLAQARRRAAAVPNVRFELSNGHDLAAIASVSIDLLLAVDSLPYMAGTPLLDGLFAETARVLRAGGDMLVFNWSYRGDAAEDIAEAHACASKHGFEVIRAGERPFTIWDGTGFHLRRL